MVSITTWNKGKAPAGTSGWNLTPDVRAALESMNVIVPVADQAERDGLTPPLGKYVGMAVTREDLGGLIQVWDGAAWKSPTASTAAVVTDANWSATGQITRALSPDGQSMTSIAERMLRTGPSFTLTTSYLPILAGFIPDGFRPPAMFNGWALLTNAADAPVATVWWRITTAGDLQARLDGGSVLLDTGHRFNLSGNWTTA